MSKTIELNNITESNSIKNYFKEIKKIELLSGDQQIELAIKAKAGDKSAFDKLVKSNLRFVISIAKEYKSSNIPLEDLISEGNFGLMEAVNRFDETKGFKFISYAVWWIRQSIVKSINENKGNIRLPINKINAINKITKAKEKLVQKLERPPTETELFNAIDGSLTIKEIKSTQTEGNFEFYIDEPISSSENLTFQDVIKNGDYQEMQHRMSHDSLKKALTKVMDDLSEREVAIITMYFGLGETPAMTLREIGGILNLTNERVRQVMKEGIRKMRVFENVQILKEFLMD